MLDMNLTEAGIAIPPLMDATMFAAEKHRGQKHKDAQGTPYVNHPIMVANLMAKIGGITAIEMLWSSLLHDTVGDAETSAEEIEEQFGKGVRHLVMEVTDDKDLEKQERKQLRIERSPHLSPIAKQIKLADKITNITDMIYAPRVGWDVERRLEYLEWAKKVVAECRGQNGKLEALFDQQVSEARRSLHLI